MCNISSTWQHSLYLSRLYKASAARNSVFSLGSGLKLGYPESERAASNCFVLRKASDLLRLMISIRFAVAGCSSAFEYLFQAITRR